MNNLCRGDPCGRPNMHLDLEPAFVLHSRPFRDTSLLVELFTKNQGRKTIIARGVRKFRSQSSGLLQPFVPLLVLLCGKSELLNLKKLEASGMPYCLEGRQLLIGFYLNELVLKLLHKNDSHEGIYLHYEQTLSALSSGKISNLKQQEILRFFELALVRELGYGLELNKDSNGKDILPNEYYYFRYGEGFVRSNFVNNNLAIDLFAGSSLISFYNHNLLEQSDFKDAKKLMQIVLAKLLNGKVIKTRELF